jgi:FHA domain
MTGPVSSASHEPVPPLAPAGLELGVEVGGDAALIRVAGVLRMAQTPALRGALGKLAVECPMAIVADLSGLLVVDRAAMRVFPAVVHGPDWWAGTELIAAAPSASVQAVLGSQPDLFDRCFPSVTSALRAVWGAPGLRPRSLREPLTAWSGAGWQARRLIDAFCATWELDPLAPSARTVTTELVESIADHGSGDMTLTVGVRGQYLHIAVRGAGNARGGDRLAPASPDVGCRPDPRRVAHLANGCGVTDTARGPLVWATMRLPPLDTPALAAPGSSAATPHPTATPPALDVAAQPAASAPVLAAVRSPAVRLALTKPVTTIGRTADNDLVLDHPTVSRLHAQVRRTPHGFVLVDLGSVNGVQLDGRDLQPHRPASLADAALVRIGDVELTFTRSAPAPAKRRRSASSLGRLLMAGKRG